MMMNIIPQTREERQKMYMKLTKAELVEMLMNNQDFRELAFSQQKMTSGTHTYKWPDVIPYNTCEARIDPDIPFNYSMRRQ